jgi:hypothetical protein
MVFNQKRHPGLKSVMLVHRLTLVMLKHMVGGVPENRFGSPVSGSENGPENEAPFGHPLWVPKRWLKTWAVF